LVRIQVEGLNKAHAVEITDSGNCLMAAADIEEMFINKPDEVTNRAIILGMRELIKQYGAANSRSSKEMLKYWLELDDARELLLKICADFPMDYTDRQALLEMDDIIEIYEYIAGMFIELTNAYKIKEELAIKVKEKVDKNQKEYIIREQLNVLNQELGEDQYSESEELDKQIEELDAGDDIKAKLHKEVKRLKSLSKGSSEVNVERTYIENCLALPWNKKSQDNNDIINARAVLDADHYGMKDVKDRIIEYLAVRNITSVSDAPILCLVGPPGTGKTSIARSVAAALNKKYIRVCLGGVRDEAEIRGHRKTYVGAMPGRIIEGLKQAKTSNPLMLLDEIDKISNDYRSDTASALLEVLDGEQNQHFVDHYIELPVDLSDVLFIATANDLSTVSRPLLDRMEIIEVQGYTLNEKMHIAKEHLVKKQIAKNGLMTSMLKISDGALKRIIYAYTKEAGVRELERQIAKICRKAVTRLYEEGVYTPDGSRNTEVKKCIRITDKNLFEYLGKEKYRPDKANKHPEVGVVRGLAWTSVGGETLEIEVNVMAGSSELKLTGNMGDVMKESAMIAYSLVRSLTMNGKYKVDSEFYDKHNIHLHIPEGAVPKDGPSAGITMTTAMLSAVTQIPVRADIAMTGEVTLRGRVLPIGGLKEKLLAARMAGMKVVLVPEENRSDVEELDEEITQGVTIKYVENIKQVLKEALVLQEN
uniref:endopeptidase La n=1 Tax=Lachnospira sp. TaxID=2049031 RepID=UPI0040259139